MAEGWLGSEHAQLLIQLLADLEAFDTCRELFDLYGSDASSGQHGSLCVRVGLLYQAMFQAVGAKLSRLADGALDWTKVRRLKLLDISRCQ